MWILTYQFSGQSNSEMHCTKFQPYANTSSTAAITNIYKIQLLTLLEFLGSLLMQLEMFCKKSKDMRVVAMNLSIVKSRWANALIWFLFVCECSIIYYSVNTLLAVAITKLSKWRLSICHALTWTNGYGPDFQTSLFATNTTTRKAFLLRKLW